MGQQLDFTITQEAGKFQAHLNCRSICGEGDTEHEAIGRLLNTVAKLAGKGSLKPEEYGARAA